MPRPLKSYAITVLLETRADGLVDLEVTAPSITDQQVLPADSDLYERAEIHVSNALRRVVERLRAESHR